MAEDLEATPVTTSEKREMEQVQERVHAWLQSMSPEQSIQHLKNLGILDAQGQLSKRYGGEGEDSSEDRPAAH